MKSAERIEEKPIKGRKEERRGEIFKIILKAQDLLLLKPNEGICWQNLRLFGVLRYHCSRTGWESFFPI